MTLLGERQHGSPGSLAETVLDPDGAALRLGSKDVRALSRGDVVGFRLNGGGGYGSPRERDPKAVEADVLDGYVSRERARRDYGWEG
jgi:N-methylhydantoinase B